MSSILLMELRRAFFNKTFVLVTGLTILVAIAQLVSVVLPYSISDQWEPWRTGAKDLYPISLFHSWLGMTPFSISNTGLFFFTPLLVCLPFSSSILMDRKYGYTNNLFTRVAPVKYYCSKLLACFLCGGVVASAPLILSVLATSSFLPMIPPEVSVFTSPVSSLKMLSDLYYSNSCIHVLLYLLINFLIGGTLACVSLCLGLFSGNRFWVVAAVFIGNALLMTLGNGTALASYAPSNILNPSQLLPVEAPLVMMIYGFLFVLIVGVLLYKACRQGKV